MKKKYLITSLYLFLCMVSISLVSRYFPIEADVVNSPIVWRSIVSNGSLFFHDWKPTVDNWYFTVYPIHFLLFYLLGEDGKSPLIIATSIFCLLVSILGSKFATEEKDSKARMLCFAALTLLSSFSFTYGFIAHPFSHNSTNAFGFLSVVFFSYSFKSKSYMAVIGLALLIVLSSISDPWFTAAFSIPILLVNATRLKNGNFFKVSFLIYLSSIILASSNLIQSLLSIPHHKFKLVSLNEMIYNAEWMALLIGKSLNLFIVNSEWSYYLSFFSWLALLVCSVPSLLKKDESRDKALLAYLSIAGVCSAFVLSYKSPGEMSMRFFMNVTCFAIIICAMSTKTKLKPISILVLCLFMTSSINSYFTKKSPLHDQTMETKDYIKFLNENKLTYGYGSFWRLSSNVNWMSDGDIHITPIFFNKDGDISFRSVRAQTLKSWHEKPFLLRAPERQFIAISKGSDTERCKDIDQCVSKAAKRFGTPYEVKSYKEITILIYNKRLFLE